MQSAITLLEVEIVLTLIPTWLLIMKQQHCKQPSAFPAGYIVIQAKEATMFVNNRSNGNGSLTLGNIWAATKTAT